MITHTTGNFSPKSAKRCKKIQKDAKRLKKMQKDAKNAKRYKKMQEDARRCKKIHFSSHNTLFTDLFRFGLNFDQSYTALFFCVG